MSFLSTGPYNYNRFAQLEEDRLREKMYFTEKAKAKKLDPVGKEDDDVDNDGDVDESDSYLKNRRNAVGKAMGKDKDKKDDKKDMKESSCSAGCDCDDCKKSKKKKMNEWIHALVNDGHDLSEYNMSDMEQMYDAAIQEANDIRYPTEPKKKFTKDKNDPGVKAGREAAKKMGLKMNEEITTEDVTAYLMEGGFCNNEVSAEVFINNMSDLWLENIIREIEEGYMSLPTDKMAKQAGKAYGKEQAAAASGNEAEANKQMQRGIAMKNPQGRKVMLSKKNQG